MLGRLKAWLLVSGCPRLNAWVDRHPALSALLACVVALVACVEVI